MVLTLLKPLIHVAQNYEPDYKLLMPLKFLLDC